MTMDAMLGVIRGGRVEFDTPVRLPDGTRVRVEPADKDDGFIREEDWPTTHEAIEALIRRMETFEPVILTPDDEARIAAARSAVREVTLAAVRKQMGIEP
jgi:hypothetical protein